MLKFQMICGTTCKRNEFLIHDTKKQFHHNSRLYFKFPPYYDIFLVSLLFPPYYYNFHLIIKISTLLLEFRVSIQSRYYTEHFSIFR